MKTNITRQNIYLLGLSVSLLIFVLLFSFSVLIPAGKEYRINRSNLNKESLELRQIEDFSYETEVILQKLKTDNRHIITAFEIEFNAQRFKKQHESFFNSLSVSKQSKSDDEEGFVVYEVNTTSEMSSPESFYTFLDAVNKSDWIIGINFPINFKRDGEIISSSFTMKVYNNKKDLTATK
ncbi:hypothetical protein HUE87_10345 [Candidatus Sulfurimonas marisnigri]|uniref:Uncharacterized protein n=1 Tax=Candidatus Sulfurimonas marisnigri TaxID=2740405 RepID=A0A7S7LZD5_9BACT|nr:hypothetical protein [Candidatus Sulfurimonas marisnigri]QOY54265.1 hypothetical protein HUE87_10345 [Candidatus Sulfurimonas marisnigri]